MLTEYEVERLALCANALRPDWPVNSLRTLLSLPAFGNKSRRDIAVALTWVACESKTKTPARVLEAGPWWKAAAVEDKHDAMLFPPRRDQECRMHAGEWPENCRGCATDKLAGDPPPKRTERSLRAVEHIGELRHLHSVATSDFCRHGVDPAHCHESHDEPSPTDQEAL